MGVDFCHCNGLTSSKILCNDDIGSRSHLLGPFFVLKNWHTITDVSLLILRKKYILFELIIIDFSFSLRSSVGALFYTFIFFRVIATLNRLNQNL